MANISSFTIKYYLSFKKKMSYKKRVIRKQKFELFFKKTKYPKLNNKLC